MSKVPDPNRRLALMVLLAASILVAACGSELSESEVLERSARTVSPTGSNSPQQADPLGTSEESPVIDQPGLANTTANGPVVTQPRASGPGATTAPASAAASSCSTGETGPIVVGNVGNYSGPGGNAFGQMPVGVQLWARWINNHGGLCGRQVQVVVQDDGGDPARYGSLVRQFVENRKVVAFVGHGASLSAQGGLAYHRQSGVPVIGTDCSADFWFDSPVLFPHCATPRAQLVGMVAFGKKLTGSRNYGYLYCTEVESCLGADRIYQSGGVEEAGASLVYRKAISVAQVDFTAECQSARQSRVELFFVAADPATLQRVAQSCARQNFFPQYMNASMTWSHAALSTKGLENVVLSMPTFPFAGAGSNPAVEEFRTAVATLAGSISPGPGLSAGWAAGKLFELVATHAAQADHEITSKGLIAALYALRNETLGGLTVPLNFGPSGAKNAPCYFTMRGDGTGRGYQTPDGVGPTCR